VRCTIAKKMSALILQLKIVGQGRIVSTVSHNKNVAKLFANLIESIISFYFLSILKNGKMEDG